MLKVRFGLLGLLMLLALGSVGSATASATAGPFWHHRAKGETGEGAKIEESAKEKVSGESASATLKGSAGGAAVEIKCALKSKGEIWNIANQGQGEFVNEFISCVLVGSSECKPVVTTSGPYVAHLMWKYQGQAKELENKNQTEQGQVWDITFVPKGVELIEKGGFKEEKSFATIKFGKGCGVLEGLAPAVDGATVAYGSNGLGAFSSSQTFTFLGRPEYEQHYWNGKEFVPLKVKLIFDGAAATFATQIPITAEKQEIAVFEK
jgi:hypothetical protein